MEIITGDEAVGVVDSVPVVETGITMIVVVIVEEAMVLAVVIVTMMIAVVTVEEAMVLGVGMVIVEETEEVMVETEEVMVEIEEEDLVETEVPLNAQNLILPNAQIGRAHV